MKATPVTGINKHVLVDSCRSSNRHVTPVPSVKQQKNTGWQKKKERNRK